MGLVKVRAKVTGQISNLVGGKRKRRWVQAGETFAIDEKLVCWWMEPVTGEPDKKAAKDVAKPGKDEKPAKDGESVI